MKIKLMALFILPISVIACLTAGPTPPGGPTSGSSQSNPNANAIAESTARMNLQRAQKLLSEVREENSRTQVQQMEEARRLLDAVVNQQASPALEQRAREMLNEIRGRGN